MASDLAKNDSALAPSQRLRVAYVLTLVGGFLDAYTYFERGGVFANAQTGNIVKLGIAFANGARDQYLLFLMPILSFIAGLLCALSIKDLLERRGIRLVRRSVIAVEIIGLAIVGLLPIDEQWNTVANCMVSFVAAMQYEAFSTFRGEAIATTMSTGNLRKFVDNLYFASSRGDMERLNSAATFFTIVCVFTLGAFFGTRACNAMGQAAVVPAIVCLAVVIVMITVLRKQNGRPEQTPDRPE